MLISYAIDDSAPHCDEEEVQPGICYVYAVQWVKERKGVVTFMDTLGDIMQVEVGYCTMGSVYLIEGGHTVRTFT